ncbi:hypothetical protein EVAR_8147_1 [Eumeta japonica]|uniref:Uncharacterized protein n=1 Tax=Eumeta variegata TaxID=151549 RepID=A0A4C1TT53_EUMVA|nr:hypothetical protein EVAR_8147_1 [Eumeta japonica]
MYLFIFEATLHFTIAVHRRGDDAITRSRRRTAKGGSSLRVWGSYIRAVELTALPRRNNADVFTHRAGIIEIPGAVRLILEECGDKEARRPRRVRVSRAHKS